MGEVVTEIPATQTGDVTLYATWVPREFNIYFHNGDELIEDTDFHTYTYGDTILSEDFPYFSDDYSVLERWNDSDGNTVKGIFPDDYGDKHFYAVVVPQVYNITYYQQEDVPARVGDVYLTYEAGTGRGGQGAPALPTLPDTAMNSFLGWSLYPNDDTLYTIGSEYCTDVELYAVYEPRKYNIYYYSQGDLVGSETYTAGTSHNLRDTDIGHWYRPGNYEDGVSEIGEDEYGDKYFYLSDDKGMATIVFLSAEGGRLDSDSQAYEGAIALPKPPDRYTRWVGTNGTPGSYGYDFDSSAINELNVYSDMFLMPGN